ncbi:MAG: ubiquinone/menaquinone biosynthesis methyltransferase [Candidatus Aminicenantes bacterium]|nr:ubiquinone/menaquinone biosynthesis methyltransferase [Candidatus Aminicenantes bacterium]
MNRPLERIFSEVAPRYELVNHVLTFGLDAVWRRKAARLAARGGGALWLDVCSGTGDMARSLSRHASGRPKIVVVDFCPAMIEKIRTERRTAHFLPVLAEAARLPFPDRTFDLVTISFATRNITTSPEALLGHLREFHRVLRPGGRFLNLETSQPRHPLVRKLFHAYIRRTVGPVGFFLSGSRAGYAYLSSTIPRFYSAREFSILLGQARFGRVHVKPLFFGVAAIHLAFKEHARLAGRKNT